MIVFVTTYSLVVPAITLSTNSAEEMAGVYLEEEAMADEEYQLLRSVCETSLLCQGG